MKKLLCIIILLLFIIPCFAEPEEIIIYRELTEQEQLEEQIRVEEREKRLDEWVKEIDKRNHELKLEEIKYKVLLETQLLVTNQSKPNIDIKVYNDSHSNAESISKAKSSSESKAKSSSIGILDDENE